MDSLLSAVEFLVISPTFLVTNTCTWSCSVRTEIRIVLQDRLNILRLIVPNQTFQLYAGGEQQGIVRCDDVTFCVLQLQSYSIVSVVLIILIFTNTTIPRSAFFNISIISISFAFFILRSSESSRRTRNAITINSIFGPAYTRIGVTIRINGLIGRPWSEQIRMCNLDTSGQHTSLSCKCTILRAPLSLLSIRQSEGLAPITILSSCINGNLSCIELLRRGNAERRLRSTSVVVDYIRLKYVELRSILVIVSLS